MKHIALVEDDLTLRENFSDLLRIEGFNVEAFETAQAVLERFEKDMPDLFILDISLGSEMEAGFAICTELRKRSELVPIIFFSSRDSDFDKASGMRLGADDYITKDASLQYLVIRIQALLRRMEVLRGNQEPEAGNRLERGKLLLDMDRLTAYWNDTALDLSLTQLWMLHALAEHPGHVLSHSQLMSAANTLVEPNTIAAHIKNIRNEFTGIDADFGAIKTERGIGYRWVE